MKKIYAIAKWEYLIRIRSKGFIISTILTPLIVLGMTFIPTLLLKGPEKSGKTIALVDESGYFGEKISKTLKEKYKLIDGSPKFEVMLYEEEQPGKIINSVRSMLLDDVISSYLIIRNDIIETNSFEYYSKNLSQWKDQSQIKNAVRSVLQAEKMESYHLDPEIVEDLNRSVEMATFEVSSKGKTRESDELVSYLSSIMFVMLLFFSVFMASQILMRSVIEERTNRVVEVLLSSVNANQLMSGKILGLGFLGLTQVALYLGVGGLVAFQRGITIFNSTNLLAFLAYFVLGYLLYAAFFAAIGAMFNSEQEAQQIVGLLSIVAILPIVLSSWVIQNPQSTVTTVLSFIPPLTPFFMILRFGIYVPPAIEIFGTLILLLVSVVLVMKAAGKIFRTAILIYGKRPTFPEVLRWIRS